MRTEAGGQHWYLAFILQLQILCMAMLLFSVLNLILIRIDNKGTSSLDLLTGCPQATAIQSGDRERKQEEAGEQHG